MHEGVAKMSADTTAPHLLYCLDYHHKNDPCSSFTSSRVVSPFTTNGIQDSGRKRKGPIFDDDSDCFDDDDSKSMKTDCDTKSSSGSGRPSNHSEIEKRRRDKMNGFITEISSLVPMCTAMSRKLDKLTVLRLAVQHIKTLRGSTSSYGHDSVKPSFMSDDELKELLKKITDGFLIVISCDKGKIIHISENVAEHLGWQQDELHNQSFVDIVHAKDIRTIKDQMSWQDERVPRDKVFSQKACGSKDSTVGSSSNVSSETEFSIHSIGAKRTFCCRFKCNNSAKAAEVVNSDKRSCTVNNNSNNASSQQRKALNGDNNRYLPFYCCGFLKGWHTAFSTSEIPNDRDWETLCNFASLVLLARPLKLEESETCTKIEFVSRLSVDGRFLYIDQNSSIVLGYLPSDMMGTSYYEYVHQDDLFTVAEMHKQLLETHQMTPTKSYHFKKQNDSFVKLTASWSLFRNPWTKEIDFLIIKQRVTQEINTRSQSSVNVIRDIPPTTLSDLLSLPKINNNSLSKTKQTKIESGKIGKFIVDTAVTETSRIYKGNKSVTISTSEPVPEKKNNHKLTVNHHSEIQLNSLTEMRRSQTVPSFQRETHGQTTLSVVMNMLETDNTGLNHHAEYTDALWPL